MTSCWEHLRQHPGAYASILLGCTSSALMVGAQYAQQGSQLPFHVSAAACAVVGTFLGSLSKSITT